MRKLCWNRSSLVALALFAKSTSAVAQPTEPAIQAASPVPAGEIIVTARRREEALQDVPAAIQALSAGELAQRNIQTEADLPTAVPGLLIRSSNSQNQLNYVIRGESTEPYSGSVPGVQPYINEVALSGNTPISFFDLQSVQVLKGPQGTLFGRNSTGGAVLYRTARPTSEPGGYLYAQYGNLDIFRAEGALNLPIAPEKAMLRLAGYYTSGGAFIHNIYNDTEQGDTNVKAARGTLLVQVSDAISNETTVQHDDFDGTNFGRFIFHVEPCGGVGRNFTCWANDQNPFFQDFVTSAPGTYFPNYPNGFVYPGGLPTLPEFLRSQGRYTVNQNAPNEYNGKATVVVNTTSVELSPSLTIKNIFGYVRSRRDFIYDNDASPYPFLQGQGGDDLESRTNRAFSDELQLQGEAFDDRLSYIIGAFYSSERTINNSPLTGFGFIPALNRPFTFRIRYKARSKNESYAVFAQGTYALTDRLNFTAGIRQTWEEVSLLHLPGSLFFGPPEQKAEQSDQSWTVSVDYHLTPDLMVYATTRGSWRVGGYNPFVRPVGNTQTAATGGNYFLPETVRDIEVGAKFSGNVAGMPVHLNANVYNLWVKNAQKTAYTVLSGNITSATVNAPSAEVTGFEAEASIAPVEWLRLGGNFSYQDARFGDEPAVLYGQTAVFGPYADAPEYSGTVFADISAGLPGEAGTLRYHVDFYAQSSFHISNLGNSFNPGDKLPGYHLLNMRLDWDDPLGADGVTASLFAKNVTDELYFTGGGGSVALYSTNSAIWGQPRTYGVALRVRY